MFPLFETLCIENGAVLHPEWHQKRYERSYAAFYNAAPKTALLHQFKVPLYCKTGLFKLRIDYNTHFFKVKISKYSRKPISTLKLVTVKDLDYGLKYSNRQHLNQLHHLKGNCNDVLLVKNGLITDTTYANIVFTDGVNWVTPNTPLLEGTCRARLLAQNSIKSEPIRIVDLKKYTGFTIINAMNDLDKNKIHPISNILS